MNPHEPNPKVDAELGASSAVVARETALTKLALEAASRATRRREDILEELAYACSQPTFAREAYYTVEMDGQTIEQPGVHLAREVARCWGHVRTGFAITYDGAERVQLRGWAWDLATGAYFETEDSVPKVQVKESKEHGKALRLDLTRNESDWRAEINRRGAITVRSALLQALPRWLVAEGLALCLAAVKAHAEKRKAESVAAMLAAFADVGVPRERLEGRLGHPVEEITADRLVEFHGIYSSIRDGHTKVADHFDLGGPAKFGAGVDDEKPKQDEAQGEEETEPEDHNTARSSEGQAQDVVEEPMPTFDEVIELGMGEAPRGPKRNDDVLDAVLDAAVGKG